MDMKRQLPEWMLCMHAADRGEKKSETQVFSNGENVEEVKKKSKMEDVKDGQVKKKSRIKDVSNGESGEERVKKKSKTKYVNGENIDGKAVEKETRSEDVNNCESTSELKFEQRQAGTEHKRARCTEDLKDELCLPVGCEVTQRRRRKVSLEDKICNYESGFERRKKRSGVAKNIDEAEPPLRRRKTKQKSSAVEITDKIEGLPQVEDNDDFSVEDLMSEYGSEDEDLTVDDLLTIAKECVNEEGKAGQNMLSNKESTVGIQHRDTDVSADSIIIKGNCQSIRSEEVCRYGISAKDTSSSEALPKPNITGSVTQDMLDLFLGSLLKKTQE